LSTSRFSQLSHDAVIDHVFDRSWAPASARGFFVASRSAGSLAVPCRDFALAVASQDELVGYSAVPKQFLLSSLRVLKK
jgi:hypothetical protein